MKKSWNTRRGDWVNSVNATLNCVALSKLLLHLEAALKTEALAPTWQRERAGWRARVEVGQLPRELEAGVRELDRNVQWARIMQADLAAGLVRPASTPLPPPLGEIEGMLLDSEGVENEDGEEAGDMPGPPAGLPRAALRMLLLLREMGVSSYEPAVALQLLEVMHAYAADVLTDAQTLARTRRRGEVLAARAGPARAPGLQQQQLLQDALEARVELSDVTLSVKGRTSRPAEGQMPHIGFVNPPTRELLAQQASELNVQPMPLLPRASSVPLPPASQWLPSARGRAEAEDTDDVAWFE